MSKPNLFVIGEPKTGTSALHHYLDQHQDISMSDSKGSSYFATDYLEEARKQGRTRERLSQEEYLERFSDDNQYRGESPAHYAYSRDAPENIAAFNEKAKIIYGVRHPVSFLKSYFLQMKKNLFEDSPTLQEALEKEESRKNGNQIPEEVTTPSKLFYSERVEYAEHLQRYLDHFDREQIYVYVYEDFKADNQKTLDEIFTFLNVDSIQVEREEHNKKKRVKRSWLRKRFLRNGAVQNWLRRILPVQARIQAGKIIDYFTLEEPQTTIAAWYENELRKRFKPEVDKINDLLQKHGWIDYDLTQRWGYTELE
jgi:hypothetical protein